MRKQRKRIPPFQKTKIDLDKVSGTESTIEDPIIKAATEKKANGDYEPVDPPFKNPEKKGIIIAREDISFFIKVAGTIIGFFITVVLPIVWYASKLDSNVENIRTEVVEVKDRTDQLVEKSIKHSEIINNLEKNIFEIKSDIKSKNINK